MKSHSAYFLVSHGSRDPRPQAAMESLALLMLERLKQLTALEFEKQVPLVAVGALELHPLPLHMQIRQFAEGAIAKGYKRLDIVPIFLLKGVHVMEDIPQEVAIAQDILGKAIEIRVRSHLGSHPALPDLLTNPPGSFPTSAKIVISHGTQRSGGNLPVEAIAAHLGAVPAYWSTAPSLETQVHSLVKQGCQQIVILPYFLFNGGITDAIAQMVGKLTHQFPYVQFLLAKPIGATPELADLIIDLIQ